eukprot:TRINITY_DN8465_c0_g1_i1.p1 TRINITY_DN8465_c0_g1~~TRINITY_DN8465_c0_g1_i1.p1  ORF type:complete len:272 (+),score=31.32 TRINITY_DN8465_c0_g1_i1:154-969(+)
MIRCCLNVFKRRSFTSLNTKTIISENFYNYGILKNQSLALMNLSKSNNITDIDNSFSQYKLKNIHKYKNNVLIYKMKDCESRYSFTKTIISDIQNSGLNKIVKLELLQNETSEKITSIWLDYHRQLSCISAVIDTDKYINLKTRILNYNRFVLPVPQDEEGKMDMFYIEIQDDNWLLTPLAVYQQFLNENKEVIPTCTVQFFRDIEDSKGIVLMRGDISDTTLLTTQKAQFIINTMQLFYLDNDKYKYIKQFNVDPNNFDIQNVIDSIDRL